MFSPPGPSRQQPQHAHQHAGSYRSPAAPVTLPPPRLGPLPGGPVPGLAAGEYTPRGRRDEPGSHPDRPRYMHASFLMQQCRSCILMLCHTHNSPEHYCPLSGTFFCFILLSSVRHKPDTAVPVAILQSYMMVMVLPLQRCSCLLDFA